MRISTMMIGTAAIACAAGLAAQQSQSGYLAPGAVDLTRTLPPAPQKGEIRYEADRQAFRAMKARIGSPRWDYATRDVKYDTPTLMADFACAAGRALSPQATPATLRLLTMASADTGRANNAAKERYKRLRPLWIDKGETCESKESLGQSYDYPSGHTTKGWTFGLILADLLPDRATPILARARAYGESRLVCRVHNMSAVEAGRLGATITMESVRQSPAYRADFAAAAAELAAPAAAPAPDPATCAADAAVLDPSPLVALVRR